VRDTPKKRNLKINAHWQQNSISGSNFNVGHPLGLLYMSPCKISAKSDDWLPSYRNLTISTWPPSAILDFPRKSIWITPHVVDPHFPHTHTHTKFGADNLIGAEDKPENGI